MSWVQSHIKSKTSYAKIKGLTKENKRKDIIMFARREKTAKNSSKPMNRVHRNSCH